MKIVLEDDYYPLKTKKHVKSINDINNYIVREKKKKLSTITNRYQTKQNPEGQKKKEKKVETVTLTLL